MIVANSDQFPTGAQVANNYDIVIVGGGLVGASLCLALAGTAKTYGLSIALLDAAPIEATTPTAAGALDGRTTALALGSRNLLHSIQLWQHFIPPTRKPLAILK